MKQLIIVPLSLITLVSLARYSGPVQPLNPSWSISSDTTPPHHGNHGMKGNGSDTSAMGGHHGKWKKNSNGQSGTSDGNNSGGATGTGNGTGTGTGTGTSSGTGSGTGTSGTGTGTSSGAGTTR